jgi:hypothetical protein
MTTLNARTDQRVGAIGRTRSGKTYLMGKLLEPQPRVIVVDSKHRVNWPGFFLTDDPDAALLRDKVIYRHEDKVPNRFWEQAMDSLAERGGGIIYCDEMAELTTPNFAPPGLKTIFRLGGEIGVGCWWSAQESTGVMNTVIRQSDILLLFLNTGASDRDKLIQTAGDMGEVTSRLGLYEFVVFQAYGEGYDPDHIQTYKYVNGT